MRIGHGFDIHRFQENKLLILAGTHIPFPKGMQAHSDGDVVLHAVCDALLGAAGLGDIGRYFPDNDSKWHSAASTSFLKHVLKLIHHKGFQVENMDITILAEVPKLAPHIERMCQNIAAHSNIHRDCINIKATTMEKLGPIGQEEAIAVHAVVLLKSYTP